MLAQGLGCKENILPVFTHCGNFVECHFSAGRSWVTREQSLEWGSHSQGTPGTSRSWTRQEGSFFEDLEGVWPCQWLGFRLVPPAICLCCFLTATFTFAKQPQETGHTPLLGCLSLPESLPTPLVLPHLPNHSVMSELLPGWLKAAQLQNKHLWLWLFYYFPCHCPCWEEQRIPLLTCRSTAESHIRH